jgi:tyrosine-protein phosphatase SIW14
MKGKSSVWVGRGPMAIMGALLAVAIAQAASHSGSGIRISNFGRVDDRYYRGAQPSGRDYKDLASMGIKTVIDLQADGEANEAGEVRSAGMRFYRIPMSDHSRPADGAVRQFLQLVNDPANQPVFVHCHGGRHRTGAMTAVYRMSNYGWSANQAYGEMQQYDFNHGFGHGALKDFVYSYRPQLAQTRTTTDSKPAKSDSQPAKGDSQPAKGAGQGR